MRAAILVLAVLFALPAHAQQPQPPDPATIMKAMSVVQAQRNAAMDAVASAELRAGMLADENAKLKAEIEDLKKKADPATPAKP